MIWYTRCSAPGSVIALPSHHKSPRDFIVYTQEVTTPNFALAGSNRFSATHLNSSKNNVFIPVSPHARRTTLLGPFTSLDNISSSLLCFDNFVGGDGGRIPVVVTKNPKTNEISHFMPWYRTYYDSLLYTSNISMGETHEMHGKHHLGWKTKFYFLCRCMRYILASVTLKLSDLNRSEVTSIDVLDSNNEVLFRDHAKVYH